MQLHHKKYVLRPTEAKFTTNENKVFKQDPFVVINIGDHEFKSHVDKHAGLNPHWSDVFSIEGYETAIATIRVYDKDFLTADNLLGEAIISLCNMTFNDQRIEKIIPLQKNGNRVGQIQLEFEPSQPTDILYATSFVENPRPELEAQMSSEDIHKDDTHKKTIAQKIKDEVNVIASSVGSFEKMIEQKLGFAKKNSQTEQPIEHSFENPSDIHETNTEKGKAVEMEPLHHPLEKNATHSKTSFPPVHVPELSKKPVENQPMNPEKSEGQLYSGTEYLSLNTQPSVQETLEMVQESTGEGIHKDMEGLKLGETVKDLNKYGLDKSSDHLMHTGHSTSELCNSGVLNSAAFMQNTGDILDKPSERYLEQPLHAENPAKEAHKASLLEKGKEILDSFGGKIREVVEVEVDSKTSKNGSNLENEAPSSNSSHPNFIQSGIHRISEFTHKISAAMEGDRPLRDSSIQHLGGSVPEDLSMSHSDDVARTDVGGTALRNDKMFDKYIESSIDTEGYLDKGEASKDNQGLIGKESNFNKSTEDSSLKSLLSTEGSELLIKQ